MASPRPNTGWTTNPGGHTDNLENYLARLNFRFSPSKVAKRSQLKTMTAESTVARLLAPALASGGSSASTEENVRPKSEVESNRLKDFSSRTNLQPSDHQGTNHAPSGSVSSQLPAAAIPFTLRSSSHGALAFSDSLNSRHLNLEARQEAIRQRIAQLSIRSPKQLKTDPASLDQETVRSPDTNIQRALTDAPPNYARANSQPQRNVNGALSESITKTASRISSQVFGTEAKGDAVFAPFQDHTKTMDNLKARELELGQELAISRLREIKEKEKAKAEQLEREKSEMEKKALEQKDKERIEREKAEEELKKKEREEKELEIARKKKELEREEEELKKKELERKETERVAKEKAEREHREAIEKKTSEMKSLHKSVEDIYVHNSRRLEAARKEVSEQSIENRMRNGFQTAEAEHKFNLVQAKIQSLQSAKQEQNVKLDEATKRLNQLVEEENQETANLEDIVSLMETLKDMDEQIKSVTDAKNSELDQFQKTLECHQPDPLSLNNTFSLTELDRALQALGANKDALVAFELSITPKDSKYRDDDQASTNNAQKTVTTPSTGGPFNTGELMVGQDEDKTKLDSSKIKPEPDAAESAEPTALGGSTQRDNVKTEGRRTFTAWPNPAGRPNGAAGMRRVKLTNLPTTSTAKTVLALVWGGRIEAVEYITGNNYAYVKFMVPEDCKQYFDACSNGIDYPGAEKRVIWVEADPLGVMSINERLDQFIKAKITRVVRAVGVDADWGFSALMKLAIGKNRMVEDIIDGKNQSGLRTVEFRMVNLQDAVWLMAELQRDLDWEHCNIYHADDPCAQRNGIQVSALEAKVAIKDENED